MKVRAQQNITSSRVTQCLAADLEIVQEMKYDNKGRTTGSILNAFGKIKCLLYKLEVCEVPRAINIL